MKKKITLLLLLICSTFGLTNCNTIGPQGPQGIQGEKGDKGETGKDGISVISIKLTASSGNVDTYTITYSDGSISNFKIKNGENGKQGIQGEKGDKGDAGKDGHSPKITIGEDGYWYIDDVSTDIIAQGKQGNKGDDGRDGTIWYSGIVEPSPSIGSNGDFYLRTSNWDVYIKSVNNTWTVVGNIKGSDGSQGIQGEAGYDGQQGEQGIPGVNGIDGATWTVGMGTPDNTKGNKGDLYLDKDSFDIYIKGDNDWSLLGNIRGNDAIHANEKLIVTYDVNGGTMPSEWSNSIQVNYGDVLTLPEPTKENYSFKGWWTGFTVNDGQYTSITPVMSSITLYAKWVANISHTIHFETNGGNTITNINYYEDEQINVLPVPTKYDKQFEGWYLDSKLTKHVAYPLSLTEDITIYANWKDAVYTVNFETNGGTEFKSQSVNAGTILTLPVPSKKNYVFEGWFKDQALSIAVEDNYSIHHSQTLYAKWTDLKHLITFASDYGTYIEAKEYVAGTTIYALPVPTRDDYIFNGWYKSSSFTNTNKVTYPFSINSDMTLYASWTANFTTISSYNELNSITNMTSNYKLTCNIDCKGQRLSQIGTSEKPFRGSFNGDGWAISNFVVSAPTSNSYTIGVFQFNSGTIKKIKFNNVSLTSNYGSSNLGIYNIVAGGIVGENEGTVSACEFTGNINLNHVFNVTSIGGSGKSFLYLGGIVGRNKGTIINCLFNANIDYKTSSRASRVNYIGLVCGYNYDNGIIEKCITIGDITAYSRNTSFSGGGAINYIGGIVGYNNAVVRNSAYLYGIFTFDMEDKAYVYNDAATVSITDTNSRVTKLYKGPNITLKDGNLITKAYIDSSSWYTNVSYLGLSSDIWDLSSMNYDNYIYLSLK